MGSRSMIVQALISLRPGAQWTLNGEGYSGLVWLDEIQPKPTQEELDAEMSRLQTAHLKTKYQRLRAAEYPDFRDYLDGVVKGDQAQVQAYIDACLAVKAKYPKT